MFTFILKPSPLPFISLFVFLQLTICITRAQSDNRLQQNMRLACINTQHVSAGGEDLGYTDYWDDFDTDGQDTYTFRTLGKYGGKQGTYTFDASGGKVAFTGYLGTMKFKYTFTGAAENAWGKMENTYQFTFTEPNGNRHTCNCKVMGREKPLAKLPAPAAGTGEKLQGVYYHYMPDIYDPLTGIKQTFSKYYYFMPTGYVYTGLPEGGLEKCNCTDKAYLKNCKTYSISGNTITFSGEGAKSFGRKGSDLVIDKETFWKVKPVTEKDLPGSYKLMWSVRSGVHQTFWNFKANRTFTQTAVGTTEVGAVFGIVTAGKAKELSGTYTIKGFTLELNYSTGEKKAFTLVHTYGDKDEITIDGASCYRM